MRSRLLLSAGCALALAFSARGAAAAPWDKAGYELTFHDEFDGDALDGAAWGKRYKWGEAQINGEVQAYVDDAFEVKNGALSILGTHAPGSYAGKTFDYRSGLIASKFEQAFGYFEIRCRMPKGQGLWPAFWLLAPPGVPGVNEIDVHEFLSKDVDTVYTTLHWGKSYSEGHMSDGKAFDGPDFTADFHTFAVDWETDHVIWLVDDKPVHTHTGDGVPQVPLYVIANLAMGGDWAGSPDATTPFPARYDIEYIRVYKAAPGGQGGAGGQAGAGSEGGAAGTGGQAQAGAGGQSGGSAGSGGSAQAGGSQAGSSQAGSGGSAQAGSGGSAQAGSGGSAQAGSGGSSQAGSGGQGGSAQAGSAGAQGGSAQAGKGGLGGSSAGASGKGGAGGKGGSGGAGQGASEASDSGDDGGCAVRGAGAGRGAALALLALAALGRWRRRGNAAPT